jgi:hypothetical protein
MGAVFFALFVLILLVLGGILFAISFVVKNKKIKTVFRLIIMVIIGLPTSWIVFLIFSNITSKMENQSNIHGYISYFTIINIVGIFGYIIYILGKKILYKIRGMNDNPINIKKILMFLLHINILCGIFPLLLQLFFGN